MEQANMNKAQWRKRARRWQRAAVTWGQHWYDLSIKMTAERDAALSKVEELRRDNVRLATELARVQGIWEADVKQVLEHAATIADLRERDRVSSQNFRALMSEKNALLAWQRRVREVWKPYLKETEPPHLDYSRFVALRQAIEGDERKGET
jgi:hypothetical protein